MMTKRVFKFVKRYYLVPWEEKNDNSPFVEVDEYAFTSFPFERIFFTSVVNDQIGAVPVFDAEGILHQPEFKEAVVELDSWQILTQVRQAINDKVRTEEQKLDLIRVLLDPLERPFKYWRTKR